MPMKKIIIIFAAFSIIACSPSSTESTENESSKNIEEISDVEEATEGLSFVNIEDGATLTSPFVLEMGVSGMQVEPKGEPRDGFGHHHLLINDDFTPTGTIIVADDTHIHYGGGQISDSVTLDPGSYKLTLQFADGMHVSYGEKWAKTINITVE
ncbi:MAG: hypothetical protein ACI8ZQ_000303 [Bacteroidia bacterium]